MVFQAAYGCDSDPTSGSVRNSACLEESCHQQETKNMDIDIYNGAYGMAYICVCQCNAAAFKRSG